jgi:SHS2 domain-containing protein
VSNNPAGFPLRAQCLWLGAWAVRVGGSPLEQPESVFGPGDRFYGRAGHEFELNSLALTMPVMEPAHITPRKFVEIYCELLDDRFLLVDLLSALIREMSMRRVVAGRFAVTIEDYRLDAVPFGASRSMPSATARRSSKEGASINCTRANRQTLTHAALPQELGRSLD